MVDAGPPDASRPRPPRRQRPLIECDVMVLNSEHKWDLVGRGTPVVVPGLRDDPPTFTVYPVPMGESRSMEDILGGEGCLIEFPLGGDIEMELQTESTI
ncbi:hypothetical protein KIPB_005582, partial [Kipferlia bialata]|eukprot:g5582.t1